MNQRLPMDPIRFMSMEGSIPPAPPMPPFIIMESRGFEAIPGMNWDIMDMGSGFFPERSREKRGLRETPGANWLSMEKASGLLPLWRICSVSSRACSRDRQV